MLSQYANTIEEHLNKTGSKFLLCQIVMRRTKQLMNGDPIKGVNIAKVGSEFNPKRRAEIPPHRFPKIALEELRQDKFTWKQVEKENSAPIEENTIVFGE